MMTKSKALTPQEMYRLRKQQEERERLAYLPPGLVNHGNTCFMNSVLQGLIATRLLSNLILFEPIPLEVQRHSANALVSQRSPQLTNGHPWSGTYQKEWVEGMHIGDVFVNVMYKAWSVQRNRGRESLTPRQLLMTLGRKYDQYLDFAQQDAHEFLRILLDAMRMEEFDVIKKRQPPPARRSARRRTVVLPKIQLSSSTHSAEPLTPQLYIPPQTQPSDELPLMSFADMLFGGQLTSVLVCQKCKNISHTYEDFNDLSLSIKAEDYAKERKRDRFKKLAKKMVLGRSGTLKPAFSSGAEPETRVASEPTLQTPAPNKGGLSVETDSVHNGIGAAAAGLLRSSSVPPSPSPHAENQVPPFEIDSSRRRSLDDLTSRGLDMSGEKQDSDTEDGDVVVVSAPPTPEERKIEFAKEPEREEKVKAGGKGWGEKLGRRLSMTVGLGRSGSVKDKEKRRSRSRGDQENPPLSKTNTLESSAESVGPEIRLSPPPNKRHPVAEECDGDLNETIRPQDRGKHQRHSDVTEDGKLKEKISMPIQKNVSPSAASSSVSLPKFPNIQRSKSPKPPKPSKGESEYLRQILADVTTSTSYTFPHLPGFNHNANGAQSATSPPSSPHANGSWFLKLGLPLPSVEECLKMFTAVEVLDGENMVGCRRCWKIANGCYRPKAGKNDGNHEEDGDDGDESDEDDHERQNPLSGPTPESDVRRPSISSASNIPVSPSSISSPSLNTYGYTSASDSASFSSLSSFNGSITGTSTSDTDLVHLSHKVPRSLPPPPLSSLRSHSHGSPSVNSLSPSTSNRLPIISTADTPVEVLASAPLTARPNHAALPRSNSYDTSNYHHPYHTLSQSLDSRESLLSIPPARSRRISTSTRSSISMTEDETSEDDLESDASHTVSVISAASSAPSISAQSNNTGAPPSLPPKPKKSKVPKPTMMRPAYKRYLIATPPPILVIHLKRFQQISKMPMMSFSSGFKKLDDYVAFPESLDLTPFLAPKKEDFGLGKKGSGESKKDSIKEKRKDKEQCMYRLYAVVVHIGNMLGGHYIAYTALPEQDVYGGVQEWKTNSAPRQWAYISDTNVRLTTLEEVLKAKAYICFYERI
ncbi:hypothetical protein E1B28_004970 [Marasmius oreades]|uniref:ubiquitinyl hydrolase 1 n=1 Tax=Marasmius oreades TaxID=181124 RepID=A0A9P7UZT1_9AGAR|nr:uncharacterized protein E1B28_004970 [Marasmius oreades]KAG7097638.1 hypothetical protein E1B28_004970 [Marasmius oreades]